MRIIIGTCLAAFCAQPVMASNVGEALNQPVQLRYESSKALFEVERCLVLRDWAIDPNVYRTPDRPNESLIYFSSSGIGRPMTVALTSAGGKTVVEVRNNRNHFEAQFEACI